MAPDTIMSRMITGTALTEASAASRARRGAVGKTTVNSTTHTATQDSPTSSRCDLSKLSGSPYSLGGNRVTAEDFEGQAEVHRVGTGGVRSG